MSYYNPYRRTFYKRLVMWLALCLVLLACGAAGGFAVGRYLYPNTAEWDLAIDDLQIVNEALEGQAESDYYRGIMSGCVAIGMQMGMPSSGVASTCSVFWQMAYERDWYVELDIESWEFPPEATGGD